MPIPSGAVQRIIIRFSSRIDHEDDQALFGSIDDGVMFILLEDYEVSHRDVFFLFARL